jgi:HK97 family phage prohead protease
VLEADAKLAIKTAARSDLTARSELATTIREDGHGDLIPAGWLDERDMTYNDKSAAVEAAIADSLQPTWGQPQEDLYVWVVDMTDDVAVYQVGYSGDYLQCSYEIADDGTVTLGDSVPVHRVTTFEPIARSERVAAVSRKKIPLSKIETRSFNLSDVQMRESEDGLTSHFTGYASTTGDGYAVQDFMGEYTETIRSGAFKKTLSENADVPLLFNHSGMPIASTYGGTMTLVEDERGLRVDADLDRRQSLTNDICIGLERGDLRQMSFSFQAVQQEWSLDYTERSVTELRLFDASIVTYPANPATTASLRGELAAALGKDGRGRLLEVAGIMAEVREGKAISAANAELLQGALDALHKADDALTQVDAALDEGQQAISETLGVADPDDDDPDSKSTDPGPATGPADSGTPASSPDGAGSRAKLVPASVIATRAMLEELRRP